MRPDALSTNTEVTTMTDLAPTEARDASGLLLKDIPLDSIRFYARNPRTNIDQKEIDELAVSIGVLGVLEPIRVRPITDPVHEYELISGHKRCTASKNAGRTHVPAIIGDVVDDEEQYELAVSANFGRSRMSPMDTARAVKTLKDSKRIQRLVKGDQTRTLCAAFGGKAESWVNNHLRLLELPAEVQGMIDAGTIEVPVALFLLSRIPNAKMRSRIANDIRTDGPKPKTGAAAREYISSYAAAPADDSDGGDHRTTPLLRGRDPLTVLSSALGKFHVSAGNAAGMKASEFGMAIRKRTPLENDTLVRLIEETIKDLDTIRDSIQKARRDKP